MFKSLKKFCLPKIFPIKQHFSTLQDNSNINTESHQYQAREFYKYFRLKYAANEENDFTLLKNTIDSLRGCKLGISLTDPALFNFSKDFTLTFKRLQTIDHLLEIMREMLFFEYRVEFFWKEAFEFVWSLKSELYKKESHIIGFFFLFIQSPYKESFMIREPSLFQEMRKLLLGLQGQSSLNKLPLEGLVEFLLLNIELGLDIQIFQKQLQEKLMPRYKEILLKSSTYFLSSVSFILHKLFFDPFPEKEGSGQVFRLINELNETVVYNDLAIYDTELQNYEFSDSKPQEIGLKDTLSYRTLQTLLKIFKDQRFYNDELLVRIEDAILRKSETDIIDFKNGSELLYHLSRYQHIGNNGLIRILEMIIWLLEEEGDNMKMYFTKTNIMRLVDGISMIAYNKNVDEALMQDVLKRLAKKIEEGEIKLGGIWEKDELEFLMKVYGMNRFSGKFRGFLNFLNEKNKN